MNAGGRSAKAWLGAVVRRTRFLERYPYHAPVLARMDAIADPHVHAMAVSPDGDRIRLHVNLEFFEANPDAAAGVLLHEIHHVVHGHCDDEALRGTDYPDLMQLAMEIAANDLVREPLPGSPVLTDRFERFGVRARQSTPEIYRKLAEARERGEKIPHPRGHGCDHVIVIDDDVDFDQLVGRVGIERAVRLLHQHRRGRAGRARSRLLRPIVDDGLPPATMDWRTMFRLMAPRARPKCYTYTFPSRRAPHRLGEVPGRRRMTSRTDRFRVMVAIDTSGSMSAPELAEIARQMQGLGRLAAVTVVECSREIQRVYPFRNQLREVQGGGGTSYLPVFEPSFLRKVRPDLVVYFTDGECHRYPDDAPHVPVLWALTSESGFGCPWGKRARLRRRELAAPSDGESAF